MFIILRSIVLIINIKSLFIFKFRYIVRFYLNYFFSGIIFEYMENKYKNLKLNRYILFKITFAYRYKAISLSRNFNCREPLIL